MLSRVKRGVKALHIYEDNHNHKHNKNKRKMASVGPDVEKLEPHMTCDNVNGVTSLGNTLATPQKQKCRDNTCRGCPCLHLQPENLRAETQMISPTLVCMAAFIIHHS